MMRISTALKRLMLGFRWCFFYVLDGVASASLRGKSESSGVAVVRLDLIGDFVLWLDSVAPLLTRFGGRPITLIANSAWSDLADRLPFWNHVISIDTAKFVKNAIYRFRTLRKISRMGFEVAIQPNYSRTAMIGDAIVRSTKAKERIGSIGDLVTIKPWEKRISDHWYTQLISADPGPMMELQRNAEFVRALGHNDFGVGIPSLPKIAELSKSLCVARPYFVVSPGASWAGRRWPIMNFAQLIDKLTDSTGWTAVLCGSFGDYQICADVASSTAKGALNLAGKTSLVELIEVIRRAEFLVGNESSAVHISSAVGTPAICILGGGQFGRFLPYKSDSEQSGRFPLVVFHAMDCFGCNWHCTQQYEIGKAVPCVAKIEVAQVLDQIEAHLKTLAKRLASAFGENAIEN